MAPSSPSQHPRLALALHAHSSPGSAHDPKLHAAMELQEELLDWYDRINRQMPWRTRLTDAEKKAQSKEERSQAAYEVWVSEIMCQQTQVATVIPYYNRWIEKYPTVHDLARANVEDVRLLWSGLGYCVPPEWKVNENLHYYSRFKPDSRATRLLSGAQKVVDSFSGLIPSDPKVLQKEIDGIGEYTAAAVTSIAYSKRVAAIDGNVQRVYSRVFAIHANPAAKATKDHLCDLSNQIVPDKRPGCYNQSVMDLGALVCTPKNPKCSECPLSKKCIANAVASCKRPTQVQACAVTYEKACSICLPLPKDAGTEITIYPMAKIRKKARDEETAVCILEWRSSLDDKDSRFLLVKRPEKVLLAGMWEMPNCDMPSSPEDDNVSSLSTEAAREKALQKLLASHLGLSKAFKLAPKHKEGNITVVSKRPCPTQNHKFSHINRDYLPIHVVITSESVPALVTSKSQARWVNGSAILTENVPVAMQNIYRVHTGITKAKRSAKNDGTNPKKQSRSKSDSDIEDLPLPKKRKETTLVQQTITATVTSTTTTIKRKIRTIQCSDDDT